MPEVVCKLRRGARAVRCEDVRTELVELTCRHSGMHRRAHRSQRLGNDFSLRLAGPARSFCDSIDYA